MGFFENKEVDFNKFYSEMGSNWLDFIFLESETDFYDRIKCILIYVHENIVNLIFNNSELSLEYGYTPCLPDGNNYIYFDDKSENYFVKKWA